MRSPAIGVRTSVNPLCQSISVPKQSNVTHRFRVADTEITSSDGSAYTTYAAAARIPVGRQRKRAITRRMMALEDPQICRDPYIIRLRQVGAGKCRGPS